MAGGAFSHRPAHSGTIEQKRGKFYVHGPGTQNAKGERIGGVFDTRREAENALTAWLREHPRAVVCPTRPLACGCGPKHGCSLGALLFRFERFRALERHLEESFDLTFLGTARKSGVINGKTAPKAGARP